jgi:Leucine-rich repeat (LRR) protein
VKKGDDPLTAKMLGQRRCGRDNNRTTFVHGDLDGDGILSEREVLRLLYTYTVGKNWGLQFESWADTTVNKCDLNGVVCISGRVAKLDLTDASMCANSERKAAPASECKGIPAELSNLSRLEILTMNRRQFLRGTLPTEIGTLTNLKYLDISSCPMVTGGLPSEIGRLTDLKIFNIGGCRFNGTIPEEIFGLRKLEKLHLSMNAFTGTVPSSVENMTNLKEMLLSRTYVNGTIPEGIGALVALENFEMYGNQLVGPIPESLGKCKNLKRIGECICCYVTSERPACS